MKPTRGSERVGAAIPKIRGRWNVLLPRSHFMGLAPLDVWARMLARGGAWRRVRPRYWPRLAWCLFTSSLATAVTLPERVLFWSIIGCRRPPDHCEVMGETTLSIPSRPPPPPQGPQVICILGYFRSGTTHLHYLLSCDPGTVTPRWFECLAPQGWVVSWSFLRWFLVPFLGSTRPQDDVAIGPEWPAEDDFALCNWSLSSSLPGRMVLPLEWRGPREGRESRSAERGMEEHRGWSAMHALDGVENKELANWRSSVRAFATKIAARKRDARVILKNPSHTARVAGLVRAFGADNIQFIHITRSPQEVVRSNLAMHRRFEPYLLQDLPDETELHRRIVGEYDATERKFLVESADLAPGRLARMRYQDLIADPLTELRRVYTELGWEWSAALEDRFVGYLRDVADYRAAGPSTPRSSDQTDTPSPQLAWMLDRFDHHRPTRAKAALPHLLSPPSAKSATHLSPVFDPLIAMLLVATLWLALAYTLGSRPDWLIWPAGVAIGSIALRASGSNGGSPRLGLYAASLTVAALAIIAYPATAMAFYRGVSPVPWGYVWDSTRDGMLAINNLIWIFLGVMTAYRLGSRKHARAPGR